MKISTEQAELMIETLEELRDELSDNKHSTLFSEQYELLDFLQEQVKLGLSDANQQRELLIAYERYTNGALFKDKAIERNKKIDEFLAIYSG